MSGSVMLTFARLGGKYPYVAILSAVVAAAGLLGAIIHGSLNNSAKPGGVYVNELLAVWFSILCFFTAVQVGYTNVKPADYITPRSYIADLIYFSIITAGNFICLVGWGLVPRWDAFAWAFISFFVAASGIAVLVFRRRQSSDDSQANSTVTATPTQEKFNLESAESSGTGNEQDQGKKPTRKCLKALVVINVIIKVFHVIFIALLSNGAAQAGSVEVSYPPRGTIYSITMEDGRPMKFHVFCQGPTTNSSRPTVFFDSSLAHGTVDFYGVQAKLADAGYHVCTYDPPGFGWSSPMLAPPRSMDGTNYYDALFSAIGETKPKILVAWGGGSTNVITYTAKKPSSVAAVVLLDVAPAGIEWRTEKQRRNLSDTEAVAYATTDIMGRVVSTSIILGLGIPWGFMSIFVPILPSPKYEPLQYYPSFRVQLWKDKVWTNQIAGVLNMLPISSEAVNGAPELVTGISTLPSNIPLLHVATNLSSTQVCLSSYYQNNPTECVKQQFANTINNKEKYEATVSLNATRLEWVYCSEDDCNLSFPVDKPDFTANAMLPFLNSITISA